MSTVRTGTPGAFRANLPQAASSEARASAFSGRAGQVQTPDGRQVQLVDAMHQSSRGTLYAVNRGQPQDLQRARRQLKEGGVDAGRKALDRLIEGVRDVQDPMVSWKATELFDGVRDHLHGTENRANRTGDWASVLSSLPVADRVVRLQRAMHALAKTLVAGKLPGVDPHELVELAGRGQVTSFNFDLDNNVMNLPGDNYVLCTKSGEVKGFGHAEWAKMRHDIGKPGPYENYKVLGSEQVFGSFQESDDAVDPGAFRRALEAAVDGEGWKAPMWKELKWSLERPESAAWTFITTARGHFPRTIQKGLKSVLQARGLVAEVPPEANIFPVSSHGLAETDDYSSEKVRFIRESLDQVDAAPFGPASVEIEDGKGGRAHRHTLCFSDDDLRTCKKVLAALEGDVAGGRWPHTKIMIRFTGENLTHEAPWARIVDRSGAREATSKETEVHQQARLRQDRSRAAMEARLQACNQP